MNFKRVYIEITNLCNLNCSFCLPHQREPKAMSIAELDHVFAQVKDYTKYIYFHVKGEPLQHPQLQECFALADQHQLKVNLTTNGTLLKQAENILLNSPALRQINISLHSYTEHHKENYLQEIIDFARKTQATNRIYTSIRLWNLNENFQADEETSALIEELQNEFSPDFSILEELKSKTNCTLSKDIFLSFDEQFQWPSLSNSEESPTGTCYGLRTQLGILSNGTVIPCCLDSQGDLALGNIFESPLSSILQTDRAQKILTGFQQRKITESLCLHCSYRNKF